MVTIKEQYVTDAKGRKRGVLVPLVAWRKIMGEMEELAAIRAYDTAKAKRSEPVPFEQAVKEIRAGRS